VIIMGSPSDRDFADRISDELSGLGIESTQRIASAHKVPAFLLDVLAGYENDPQPKVYITVAGRSNALSGMVDAQVSAPVIACPPYSDKFGGGDIFSSLRSPSGVAPAVVLEPVNAALLAAKVLSLADNTLAERVRQAQREHRDRLRQADQAIQGD
jgi:phosphoribosylaminoimidazole carboxylase PurE protein